MNLVILTGQKYFKRLQMKCGSILLFVLLIIGCNENSSNRRNIIKTDSTKPASADTIFTKSNGEKELMDLSKKILSCFKKSNLSCLAQFVHPKYGVRFSPYGYIDTASDKIFSKEMLSTVSKTNKKLNWGVFDGSGEKIFLTPQSYLHKFVYDVDFLNATEITINKRNYRGTILHNIDSIYSPYNSVEMYFPGFDSRYDGMDWRALYLIFKEENGKSYLVGVVHDQWTI